MKALITTRDNFINGSLFYKDSSELNDGLGQVLENILGLDSIPNNVKSIPNINCILEYQGYSDRLHEVTLDTDDFTGKDYLIYYNDQSLLVSIEELRNNPELLGERFGIDKEFFNYFLKLTPRFKVIRNLNSLLEILKSNFNLNYINL
jgi:hypothetical protein